MKTLTSPLPAASVAEKDLSYVIIGARYRDEWIFVRNHDRQGWEIPAGHIEAGENPDRAAERELYEETGALQSSLTHIWDYRVKEGNRKAFGRLYLAEVQKLGPLPRHEIAEIKFSRKLPGTLTYPEVQQVLFSLLTLH